MTLMIYFLTSLDKKGGEGDGSEKDHDHTGILGGSARRT
jgi:hypothetical protein